MKKYFKSLLCGTLALCLLAGCGGSGGQPASSSAGQETTHTNSVVIAMGPTSEPEAGFDPVYGWGAGEHVHEPLIQSTLTVSP